ncbi:MAG: SPFH domain-containing protein, partial [Candidatus Devosia euplotis]|nr:SPFH domain-containing protein [Candidatus Devosia euplotis]
MLLVMGLVAGYMGYYTVEAGHVGVVTRFGKYIEEVPPGLHFKVPFGVDQVVKVPVERRQKMEFGFETTRAGVQTEYAKGTDALLAVSSMLTGD